MNETTQTAATRQFNLSNELFNELLDRLNTAETNARLLSCKAFNEGQRGEADLFAAECEAAQATRAALFNARFGR